MAEPAFLRIKALGARQLLAASQPGTRGVCGSGDRV